MLNGSNCCLSLGSQLGSALCASLEGTLCLLVVERAALMEILVGEIQEGFREALTLRLCLSWVGFPLLYQE